MADFNQPITFRQLLAKCPRIEVPLIRVFPASVHDESHSRLIMFLPHSARVMMGGRDGESDGRHQEAGARIISDA
jgi:hypothetical protein